MEQLFLSKITVWNFSFVEILYAVSNFTEESRVVDMESFLIELTEAIVHFFGIFLELARKHPQRNTTSDNRV